jgi:uncharacterized protein YkuJ
MVRIKPSHIALSEHERFESEGTGICYIVFSREDEKRPIKRYEQLDVLPFASADSEETFVRPQPIRIPGGFALAYVPWVQSKAEKT